ncbi:hypothetical protein DWX61_13095 [Ruminococcus sp. AF20-12LB]|nr:hypothetical protein DWX61_13095 [Ruminococcus sp. AF20-12LB]
MWCSCIKYSFRSDDKWLVQRILSNRHIDLPDFSFVALPLIVVVTATPHSSALQMKKSSCVNSRNLIFAVLAANCGEFANAFSMDYSISRENEAREEALLNESSKYSVHREACC